MTYNIIKTENYLLVVDDSEIKEDVWFYHPKYNKVGINYNPDGCKKIIAHLPLTISPVLEGVDLLPPLEDDDCDSLQMYVESLSQPKYPIGFKLGNEVDNKTYTSITRRHDGLTLWIGKYIY
jgi:hypothetical protein